MEPTGTIVLRRLLGAVLLAAVTGLAVGIMAMMMDAGPARDVRYVVPHQYESQQQGPVVSGTVTDPRR